MSQGTKTANKKEREYYKTLKDELEQLLKTKFSNFHLEITADKKFSNKLKAEVSQYKEIKRLSRVAFSLLSLPAYKTLTIVHYDEESKEFQQWFPKNPFEED